MRGDIIKDSSVWRDNFSYSKHGSKDGMIRIGIVRSVSLNKVNKNPIYIVEVQNEGDKHVIPCRLMNKFGGAYNYEENTIQTYNFDQEADPIGKFETKAGDAVVICHLNGDPREGLILGGLQHASRENKLDPADGPQHFMTINGIEREINKDGEFTLTFRGKPTNIDILSEKPGDDPIPVPEYNNEVGTTFMKFDMDGGWTISDNATEDPQSISINKVNGTTTITSGKIKLTMTKSEEAVSLKTKTLLVEAEDSINNKTKDWKIKASKAASIKAPKVAIGSDGVELLDKLVSLIDAVGTLTIITPVGPASPVTASPQWSAIDKIKSDINSIKGTL